MKNKLQVTCLALFAFALSSCVKTDPVYSCDPEVDQWTVQNVETIKRMDRVQFQNMESSAYQRAAFGVFSAEQRLEIWKGKFAQVLSLDVWNEREIEHIKKFETFLIENKELLNSENKTRTVQEQEEEKLLITAFVWVEYAREELGWNDELIASIVTDPNDLNLSKGKTKPQTRIITDITPGKKYCECTEKMSPINTTCACRDLPCTKTSSTKGCGYLWVEECTGLCFPYK